MAKIYVSSTYLDLQEYRAHVERVIRRMGHTDVTMEYYVAEDTRPVAKCLADVTACDLYVGIFAWRYGYIPAGQDKSVTEQEYRKAIELGKPCFIFILKDDAPWQPSRIEFPQIERRAAVSALAEHYRDHPDTLPLLRDRAENDPTPWLRDRAKELAGDIEKRM